MSAQVAQTCKKWAWPTSWGFTVAMAIMCGLFMVASGFPDSWWRGLTIDNDSLTRISFLRWQLDHGTLTDYVFPRYGAPEGMQLHWTLPFDVLCLALAAPLAAFEGWDRALVHASLLAGPLGYAGLCAAVLCLCRSLGQGRAAPWALLAMAFSRPLVSYAEPGRLNHHIFTVAMATMCLALSIRLARSPRLGTALWAAAWTVLSVWESMETVAVAIAATALVALASSYRPVRLPYVIYAIALPLICLAAIGIDPDPLGYSSFAVDRLSLFHLGLLGAAGALTALAPRLSGPGGVQARCRHLALWALLPAMPLSALAWLNMPPALSDPVVGPILGAVSELAPAWHSGGVAEGVAFPQGLALLLGAWTVWRCPPGRSRQAWSLALMLLCAQTALGALHARLNTYAAVSGCIILGCFLQAKTTSYFKGAGGRGAAAWFSSVCACVLAATTLGLAAMSLATWKPTAYGCRLDGPTATLIEQRLPPGAIVAVDLFNAPDLVERTDLRVVAGPYHRDLAGLRDITAIFAGKDDSVIRAIMARRGIAAVIGCRPPPGTSLPVEPGSLAARLESGAVPRWLHRVDLGSSSVLYLVEAGIPLGLN